MLIEGCTLPQRRYCVIWEFKYEKDLPGQKEKKKHGEDSSGQSKKTVCPQAGKHHRTWNGIFKIMNMVEKFKKLRVYWMTRKSNSGFQEVCVLSYWLCSESLWFGECILSMDIVYYMILLKISVIWGGLKRRGNADQMWQRSEDWSQSCFINSGKNKHAKKHLERRI